MNAKDACAVVMGIAFLVVFTALLLPGALPLPAGTPLAPGVGTVLWKDRAYEALLQGMIILAGVLSILLLLGRRQSGRMPP